MATVKAKSPAKKTQIVEKAVKNESPVAVKIPKSYAIWGIAIILLAVFFYMFRSLFIVAVVNGQPISRLALIQELEKQGAKQTLTTLVTKTLIQQEASKKNITVTQSEIDSELKKIETNLAKQGQTLDQVLKLQGMTRQALTDQIRLQKMIEKLIGKDVVISDKDVTVYMEANKSTIPQGGNMTDIKKSVREQLKQQKLNGKVQGWLENVRKQAKINYLIEY